MFKDSKDGQTHYIGDGCNPAHTIPENNQSQKGIKCPVCNGSGLLTTQVVKELNTIKLKKKIIALHKKGLSFRQIMKAVGLKSPNTIAYHLKTPL